MVWHLFDGATIATRQILLEPHRWELRIWEVCSYTLYMNEFNNYFRETMDLTPDLSKSKRSVEGAFNTLTESPAERLTPVPTKNWVSKLSH